MKKIISTILTIAIISALFSCFSISASAYDHTDSAQLLVKLDYQNSIAQVDTSGFSSFNFSVYRLSMDVKVDEEAYIGTFEGELPDSWTVTKSTGENPIHIEFVSGDNKTPLNDQNLFTFFYDSASTPVFEVSNIVIKGKDASGKFIEYSIDAETSIFDGGDGDVNGDGVLDIIDVVMTRSHIVGNKLLNDEQQKSADINGDKSVDIVDVALMRRTISNGTIDAQAMKVLNTFGNAIVASSTKTELSDDDINDINKAVLETVQLDEDVASWTLDKTIDNTNADFYSFYDASAFDIMLENYVTGTSQGAAARNELCKSSSSLMLTMSVAFVTTSLKGTMEENNIPTNVKYKYNAGIFKGEDGNYLLGIACKK